MILPPGSCVSQYERPRNRWGLQLSRVTITVKVVGVGSAVRAQMLHGIDPSLSGRDLTDPHGFEKRGGGSS